MVAHILNMIESLGSMGLFLCMFLEGCSLPFPGIIVILTLGYLLHPGVKEIFWLSFGMAAVYSIASYIPYAIGRKLEISTRGKLSKKLIKAQYWFRRYGEFSVCITRPFALGNYISYAAGMSRVKPWRYGLLTFLGIFPWAFGVLLLGKLYHGSLQKYSQYMVTPLILFILIALAALFMFRRANTGRFK